MSIDAVASIGDIGFYNDIQIDGVQKIEANKFGELIADGVANLNDSVLKAESAMVDLVSGEADNLHQVMIELEKSKTEFQFALQVRNKILDAYKEVMRMQM